VGVSFICEGNRSTRRKPPTCCKSLTYFITCFIEYAFAWAGFELTTLVVIGTDCIGSFKSKYHTFTTTTDPYAFIDPSYIYIYIRLKIKPNSVRIRFLELSNFCSSLDGIWTHTIDTLQHHSLSLTSSALDHLTTSTPSKVTMRSSGTDILYGCHLLLDVYIYIYIYFYRYLLQISTCIEDSGLTTTCPNFVKFYKAYMKLVGAACTEYDTGM
jgi:hypothetical protein